MVDVGEQINNELWIHLRGKLQRQTEDNFKYIFATSNPAWSIKNWLDKCVMENIHWNIRRAFRNDK